MRSVLRGCAAAALVGAVVAAPGAAAHADTLFQAQTAATAAHFVLTQNPPSSIITGSLVDDAASYAAGAFDSSGGSDAQAATLYPGNLVVQGPALFCSELFPCPAAPPDYPLLADASYPRRAHATATANGSPVGSGPFVLTPAAATATATGANNSSATTTGGLSVLSGTPVATTVGSSSAGSRIVSTGSAIVVHVETVVHDIEIGGLVHIASVDAVDDVTLGGTHRDSPHITVSGASVGGVAATIDDHGLHVAGADGPSLSQHVTQNGISIRLVGAQQTDTSNVARSDAVGLEVTFAAPVSGVPYVPNPISADPFNQIPGVNANGTYIGHLTLGAVGVVAGANAAPTFDLGGITPLPATPGAPPAGAVPTSSGGGAVAALPLPAREPVVSTPRGLLHYFLDGFTTDLANLYAVLALGTVALFVGWRGVIALRRRRPVGGTRA